MSRGLGDVERRVIRYLEEKTEVYNFQFVDRGFPFKKAHSLSRYEASIDELVCNIQKHYQSVTRAVRGLKQKNLVETRKLTTKNVKDTVERQLLKKRNSNYIVMVKLSEKLDKSKIFARYGIFPPYHVKIKTGIKHGRKYVELVSERY